MAAFEFNGDRLHERLLRIGLNDPAARLLNRGEEVLGGNSLVVRKGDAERELIDLMIQFAELDPAAEEWLNGNMEAPGAFNAAVVKYLHEYFPVL